jgi:hypothetical protein
MKELIEKLHSGNYSCVIACGDNVRTFSQKGVADLYDLLNNEPDFLKNASIADKIVGKAAAALIIIGGIAKVYADVISTPALELLKQTSINVQYGEEVSVIENKDGTGMCPMETLVKNCSTVQEILPIVEEFISNIRKRK